MAGRLQNLKPWRKGQSGNPGGRPRRKLLTAELERLLEQKAPNAKGKTWAAAIAEALLRQALKGNVRAVAEISDRMEGKARQAVEVSGPAGDPITLLERIKRAEARLRAKTHSEKASLRGRARG